MNKSTYKSRKHLRVLILKKVNQGIGNLANFKLTLIGGLLMKNIYRSQ